jgi:hypothetical protein
VKGLATIVTAKRARYGVCGRTRYTLVAVHETAQQQHAADGGDSAGLRLGGQVEVTGSAAPAADAER